MRLLHRQEMGDEAGALEDVSQAVQLDPNKSAVYDHRGCVT